MSKGRTVLKKLIIFKKKKKLIILSIGKDAEHQEFQKTDDG